MKTILKPLLTVLFLLTILNCNSQKKEMFSPEIVYKSDDLIITQIAENSFEHTSFKQTNDFGKVPCNGLIVRNNNETIIFDTTTGTKSSEELIKWIQETLHCRINAIIATHFHDDCTGGLQAFDDHNIPSYAYFKTIQFTKDNNYVVPKNSFEDSLTLKIGDESVMAKFFGEGHTKDNVVGYFSKENIMFGGCLIKELGAGKGYLGDSNVKEWSKTVEKVKKAFPEVEIVVPGHGKYGNKSLFDYTIGLFKNE